MKFQVFVLAGMLVQGLTGSVQAQTVYEKAMDPNQRIAFDNDGGLLNGGVCWWHSRLQRAFYEIVTFDPQRPKPSSAQVRELLNQIMMRNSMVLIPGFADVYSFTSEFEEEVQAMLNRWQILDGFVNQEWIRGISGRSTLEPSRLKAHLDRIFSKFKEAKENDDLLWVMLQAKGITSHASLILEMAPTADGYDLTMLDSNFSDDEMVYHYKNGDTTLTAYGNEWIPYLGFSRDLRRMSRAQSRQEQQRDGLRIFLNQNAQFDSESVIE